MENRSNSHYTYYEKDKQFKKRQFVQTNDSGQIIYVHTSTSTTEIDLGKIIGRKKKVLSRRNFIPMRSSGDKPYRVVEQIPNYFSRYRPALFHRNFSSLVPFEVKQKQLIKNDPMHQHRQNSYISQTETFNLENELSKIEVKSLDSWRPKSPLKPSFKYFNNTHRKHPMLNGL
ncbi:hypothetical protein SNEBB_011160 [Seison nebaliae]|nr:hypothetical protein SNEBB_011160 [Seison nebaliae]